jgi:hypothetical protein
MRIAWLVTFALATGCSGLVDDGADTGLSSAEVNARRLWINKALPVLVDNCSSCHATGQGGSQPAPTFLAGDGDLGIRDTLRAHDPPQLDFRSPPRSRLLTRGPHDGPALDGVQSSDLLEWIFAEKEASPDTQPVIEVAKFAPSVCTAGLPDDPAAPNPNCLYNRIPLDPVGGAGAQIEFILQAVPDGSYMTNLRLVPGPGGVYMEHPIFITWPAAPRPGCDTDASGASFCLDSLDRYAQTTLNLMTDPAPIGSGTTTFAGFLATDMMSIQFTEVGAYKP